ncbi:WD40 repeat-like protein [Karstenula rhodostoma CBS 690.94]|uniref:WD40 repeat-like protein n=1 Tax=Karstenula rhodostoma CBS 690.94 TaxID=1392251 RepID=A0A9P4UAL8_9PLEO|nr:WD40 repeat-like protein [Karstenula rhodostoma CBS 690.94]
MAGGFDIPAGSIVSDQTDSRFGRAFHQILVDLPSDTYTDHLFDIAFLPNESKLATATGDRVAIWDTSVHKVLAISQFQGSVVCLHISTSGLLAAITHLFEGSSLYSRITVMNCDDGEILQELEIVPGEIRAVRFSPDPQWLASDSADGKLRICATNSFDGIAKVFEHRNITFSTVSFSYDSSRIAATYSDKSIAIWKLDGSGEPERFLLGHRGVITSIQFSPIDYSLSSSASDKTVRIWDTNSEVELVTTSGSDQRHAQSVIRIE